MPPRKAHRKSRTGCIICKKRHVKCGEERPNCSNCLEYDLECYYAPVTTISLRDSLRSSSESSHSNDATKTSIPDPISGHDDLEVSDLELMHFFSTVTYTSMSSVPAEQKVWQTTIIPLGFQHKFLLRGLLAHAALHLSYLKPGPDSINYYIKATTHQEIALIQFRKSLETVAFATGERFDALLAFSCLLPIHSISLAALATTRPQKHAQENDSLSELQKAIHLFRSVNRLLFPYLEVFTNSTILPLMHVTSPYLPQAETYPGLARMDFLEQSIHEYIFNHPPNSTNRNADLCATRDADRNRNAIFSDTIRELRYTFARGAHPANQHLFALGIVMIWTITVPEEFMALLDQRDRGALVVLAYFAALLAEKEDGVWWISGFGGSLVGEIERIVGDDWRDALEWPREAVERARRRWEVMQ